MASYLLSVWNTGLNPHETFSTREEESLTLFQGSQATRCRCKATRGHLLPLRRETQHTLSTGGVLRATIWRNRTCFSKATAEKLDLKSHVLEREDWNVVLKSVIIFVNGSDMNNAKSWESWDAKFAVLYYFCNFKKTHQTYDPLHILGSSSQNDKRNYFIVSCTGGRCAGAAKTQ